MKPGSKSFDERSIDEMLVKSAYFVLYCSTFISNKLFEGAYFVWWLYFERLKFDDLTLIRQIRQSFHSSMFLVLRYCNYFQYTWLVSF